MPPVYPNNLEFARGFKRNGSDEDTKTAIESFLLRGR